MILYGSTNQASQNESLAVVRHTITVKQPLVSQRISQSVKRAKFFSLTMDGSTDEATVEQETLFKRFCCQGDIVTKFLTIGEPASTSSADLYTFVTNILKTHELNQNISFIGFGCDGAANMVIFFIIIFFYFHILRICHNIFVGF